MSLSSKVGSTGHIPDQMFQIKHPLLYTTTIHLAGTFDHIHQKTRQQSQRVFQFRHMIGHPTILPQRYVMLSPCSGLGTFGAVVARQRVHQGSQAAVQGQKVGSNAFFVGSVELVAVLGVELVVEQVFGGARRSDCWLSEYTSAN